MPEFIHDGQSIFYKTLGADDAGLRTPLLLLHGNGEDMDTFQRVVPLIEHSKRIVLMDSRLQGRSCPSAGGSERLSYELIASDALALMEHLGVREYDVVGYSDGGIAGLIMAMRSNRIRKLITLGANTDPSGLTAKARREIRAELKKACGSGDALTAELMRLMLEEPNISADELASIICEVTVILGSRDALISKKHSLRIASSIPRASHIILDGAGHDIPLTHANELAKLILNAL